MVVLPDRLLRSHSFAGKSRLKISREGKEVLLQIQKDKSFVSDNLCELVASSKDPAFYDLTSNPSAQHVPEENYFHEVFNRKKAFFIDGGPNTASTKFHTVKKQKKTKHVHRIIVFERETENI